MVAKLYLCQYSIFYKNRSLNLAILICKPCFEVCSVVSIIQPLLASAARHAVMLDWVIEGTCTRKRKAWRFQLSEAQLASGDAV